MYTNFIQTNIRTAVNDRPMALYQVIVVLICFVLNFNDGIDVLLVSFTGPSIAHDLGLNKAELGYIFSASLAGMTAGCFLLAPLGDKIGRRPVFILSLLAITTGMLLVYFTANYPELLICRCITGLGIGGILPNLATIASEFSNQKHRDFNVGAVQAGWPLGAILTGLVTAKILPLYGWKFTYLVSGSFSLLMLILVFIFLPESPLYLMERQPANALKKLNRVLFRIGLPQITDLPQSSIPAVQFPVRNLFSEKLKASTLLLWSGIFLGFLTLYTVLSWVPNLAKDTGMPAAMSVYLGTTLNAGAFTGVLAMGIFISRFGIKRVMAVFFSLAFMAMIVFGNLHLQYIWMFILAFFIGFFVQGGFNAFYPAATRIYPAEIRSTGVGLAMGVGRFGAIIGPALFGIFADMGISMATRFLIFSIPLLLAALMVFKIPSKNIS